MRSRHAIQSRPPRLPAPHVGRVLAVVLLVSTLFPSLAHAASALPEFAYRHVTLKVESADARPVPNATLYGFCPDLNLLWPRRDREPGGRNDILWQDNFLATTSPEGTLSADLPPGNWRFFAAGHTADDTPVFAWTTTQIGPDTQTIRLAPTVTKHWTFRAADSSPLAPTRLLVKPDTFPIWIPITLAKPIDAIQLSPGKFQLHAQSDPTPDRPGFALSFGALSDQSPDGPLTAPGNLATVETTGGNNQAVLSYSRRDALGLTGEFPLPAKSKLLLTPGPYTLSYRRPISTDLTASFIGELYNLQPTQITRLNFDAPLTAAVDHELSRPDKAGSRKLVGQLYLVDPNGHPLGTLLDADRKPVPLSASVTLAGKQYAAAEVRLSAAGINHDPHEELDPTDMTSDSRAPAPPPFAPLWGQTLFRANVGPATSDADATWTFTAPAGLLLQPTLPKSPHVTVTSASFKIEVPEPLRPHATNILAQAETLARTMEQVTGRTRRRPVTTITISPPAAGAVSTHDGTSTKIGTRFFFSDQPMAAHTFVHELAHNFNYTHGGLQEAVVELARCSPNAQVSAQPAKWLFLDRMNGLPTAKETPYPNAGLYLYTLAQAGPRSLLFLSRNEPTVRTNLATQYTPDDLTSALLSAASAHDLTPISLHYGLTVSPDRAPTAIRDAKALSDTRR